MFFGIMMPAFEMQAVSKTVVRFGLVALETPLTLTSRPSFPATNTQPNTPPTPNQLSQRYQIPFSFLLSHFSNHFLARIANLCPPSPKPSSPLLVLWA